MSKAEECDRCTNFSGYEGHSFLVCAMHPAGPSEAPCPDWELAEDDGWFLSREASVDGEQILAQASCLEACDRNIAIIIHPRISGYCPDCGFEFDRRQPPLHWDCDICGWMDDSS